MEFEADYYDGISPRAKRVMVSICQSAFLLSTTHTLEEGTTAIKNLSYLIKETSIQAKLGRGKRLIDLPDGGRLETDFQDLEMHLPAQPTNIFWRIIHYTENHKLMVLLALLGIVLASRVMLEHGVPIVAKYVASVIPESVETDLGKQTMDTLDSKQLGYLETSKLPLARQESIKAALVDMCTKTNDCPIYQLNFRKSDVIGPNAFALPGGQVVITDELIALSKNNDEIIAVLAHELGHVKKRHALRQTLQGTISGLIIIAITGDVSSIASGLPALILNMRYSRDLETEADNYSFESLKSACIPTKYFATLLLRLQASHVSKGVTPEIISSHPDTQKRIAPFLNNHNDCSVLSAKI